MSHRAGGSRRADAEGSSAEALQWRSIEVVEPGGIEPPSVSAKLEDLRT